MKETVVAVRISSASDNTSDSSSPKNVLYRHGGREMRYEGSPVKAPPQNSYTSFERKQGSYEVEGRGWSARERTIIARTKQFLEKKL